MQKKRNETCLDFHDCNAREEEFWREYEELRRIDLDCQGWQAQMADDDQMGRMTNTQRNGSILMMILIADD